MRVRDELRGGIGLILAFQFVTAAAGIALLGRTGPAIESILAENDVSLEAAEAALVILATPAPVVEADTDAEHAAAELAHFGQEHFEQALLAGGRSAPAYAQARARNLDQALAGCLEPALAVAASGSPEPDRAGGRHPGRRRHPRRRPILTDPARRYRTRLATGD